MRLFSPHCGMTACLLSINYFFVPSHQELEWALLAAAQGGRTKEVIALLVRGADLEVTDVVRHVQVCQPGKI